MKLLYLEQPINNSGEQIVMYDCQNDFQNPNDNQTLIEETFPSVTESIVGLIGSIANPDIPGDPPEQGDVLWTHTPGNNRVIAHCMMYDIHGKMDFGRLPKMFQSIDQKIEALGQDCFAMTLMGYNWNEVWPILEENVKAQGVVYIPTNEQLVRVLEGLGNVQMFSRNEFAEKLQDSPPES
jgi:hypothetical protein